VPAWAIWLLASLVIPILLGVILFFLPGDHKDPRN
jgi:hypothetical protein